MEDCVDEGLVKYIGLSNFNSEQIQRILDVARIKPVINQVLLCSPPLYKAVLKLLLFNKNCKYNYGTYFGSNSFRLNAIFTLVKKNWLNSANLKES